MKNNKLLYRIVVGALALVLALSLVACGGDKDETDTPDAPESTVQPEEEDDTVLKEEDIPPEEEIDKLEDIVVLPEATEKPAEQGNTAETQKPAGQEASKPADKPAGTETTKPADKPAGQEGEKPAEPTAEPTPEIDLSEPIELPIVPITPDN